MDATTTAASAVRRHRRILVTAPLLATLALAAAGCGSSDSASTAGDAAGANTGNAGSVARAPSQAHELTAGGQDATSPDGKGGGSEVQQRAVISTGEITLSGTDLADLRQRLDGVLAKLGGQVADEDTRTSDDGTITHSRLVVRVPSDRFDSAMDDLSGIARLRSSSRSAEDVTTRVIDLGSRIAAERAGVRRLRELVGHTAGLGALLDVERALTQRQGVLESLLRQRAYLADQTSLATITVDATLRTPVTPKPPAKHAAGGFVGGLHHGWTALVAVVTAALVAVGALLPFAGLFLLLGLPTWLLVRRLQRQRRVRDDVQPEG